MIAIRTPSQYFEAEVDFGAGSKRNHRGRKIDAQKYGMTSQSEITYQSEIQRKGIHLLSLGIPLVYSFVDKQTALWLLVPLTLAFVLVDVVSHRSGIVRELVLRYFGGMMRTHEKRVDKFMLNGASYVLLSACMCVLFFPKIIAITAFSILIVSDICAALFGRRYGRHRFLDKSLEGTIAFAISAFVVVGVIAAISSAPLSFSVAGTTSAIIGALIENVSPRLRLDDNVSIPASIGISMWVLALTLLHDQQSFLTLLQ